jgi:hypothetical protein
MSSATIYPMKIHYEDGPRSYAGVSKQADRPYETHMALTRLALTQLSAKELRSITDISVGFAGAILNLQVSIALEVFTQFLTIVAVVANSDSPNLQKALDQEWAMCTVEMMNANHCLLSLELVNDLDSPPLKAAAEKYRVYKEHISTLENAQRDVINRRLATASLIEAHKSIEQAESVNNLTLLAFIFAPLSFAASLFGMNVQEVNESGPRVVYFVATALPMVLVSIFAFILVSLLASYRKKRREERALETEKTTTQETIQDHHIGGQKLFRSIIKTKETREHPQEEA